MWHELMSALGPEPLERLFSTRVTVFHRPEFLEVARLLVHSRAKPRASLLVKGSARVDTCAGLESLLVYVAERYDVQDSHENILLFNIASARRLFSAPAGVIAGPVYVYRAPSEGSLRDATGAHMVSQVFATIERKIRSSGRQSRQADGAPLVANSLPFDESDVKPLCRLLDLAMYADRDFKGSVRISVVTERTYPIDGLPYDKMWDALLSRDRTNSFPCVDKNTLRTEVVWTDDHALRPEPVWKQSFHGVRGYIAAQQAAKAHQRKLEREGFPKAA